MQRDVRKSSRMYLLGRSCTATPCSPVVCAHSMAVDSALPGSTFRDSVHTHTRTPVALVVTIAQAVQPLRLDDGLEHGQVEGSHRLWRRLGRGVDLCACGHREVGGARERRS